MSRDASDWFQGAYYSGPELENWYPYEGEPVSVFCARVVSECWVRGEPIWRTFETRRSLFDLLSAATPPFEHWAGSNKVACAALYIAVADLLGLPVESCLPTLERLWTRVRYGGGLLDLTIEQLFNEHRRQR